MKTIQNLAASGVAFAALTLLSLESARAQGHPISARGLTAKSTYTSDGIDSVNNFNRSLSLTIPLGAYPLSTQSGYGVTIYYSSQVWDLEYSPSGCNGDNSSCLRTEPDASSNAGLGWHLSLGQLLSPASADNESDRYVYVGPDGGRHYFYDTLHEGEAPVTPCDKVLRCATQFTRDGSYLRLKRAASTVEFPDGSIHTFAGSNGELTRIQDSFGNYLNVVVTTSSWTLDDQFGRHHVVSFATVAGKKQVSTVDLAAFGGTRSIYTFNYETASIFRPYMDTDDLNSAQVSVGLLSSITHPSGISYTMTQGGSAAYYRGSAGTTEASGQLRFLQLPTKGTMEWTYDLTHYPVSSSWAYFENGFGVASKATGNSWGTGGTWTYSSVLYPTVSPTELQTTVVDPANVRRVYYFSTPTTINGSTWTGWEYGLPFTARLSNGGKYLSSETFPASGGRVRSTWLTFTHDMLIPGGAAADWYNSNRRVNAARTKFDDDGARYSDRSLSGFDGLGHYRDVLLQGNFDISTSRTETTQFNSTRGCYEINLTDNSQTCSGTNTFVPFANNDKWILGTFTYTQQLENLVTARQEMSFNSANGFLNCVRSLKSGTARNSKDVVVTFGNDGAGNVAFEKYWGGDQQSLGTGATCDTTSAPAYWIAHSYASGVMSTARYKTSSGTDMNFLAFNASIDNSTGLVRDSYDESGFLTRFTYDTLSRPTLIEPNGAVSAEKEAKTSITYSNASGSSTPARISVYRSCPTGETCTPATAYGETETSLDGFGRVWRERVRQLDGSTWARRETAYNAFGWRTSVSEMGPNTGALSYNSFTQFDSFGRPGRLTKADGKIVNFTYSGAREFTRRTKVFTTAGALEVDSSTTEGYDALGRLRRVWEPAMPDNTNVNTNYTYDVGNRLKEVDQVVGTNHQHRYFNYDNRGFLNSESHPEKGGSVTYLNYDARGHAQEIQDGLASRNLLFSFDAAERLMTVTEGGVGGRMLKEFSYGAAGNGLGKLLTAKRHNYLGAPFNTDYLVAETYEYNGIGRRPSKRTTQLTIFGVSQERFEQAWTYDRGGNTATITYPICFAGTCPAPGTTPRTASYTVTNGYLTAIPGWANSISYQLNGMLNTTAYANNISQVVVNDPNSIPRPQDIQYKVTSTGALIGSLGPYEYDSSGNIKKLNGLDFTYDLVSRLKSGAVNVVGVPKTFTAAYDGYGNITSLNHNGLGRSTPTSLSTNRLTSGVYDVGGNLTALGFASYGYDRLNMPTQICSSGTLTACTGENWLFAYTADDERILEYRVGGGAFRTTLRDLSGKALREYFVEAGSNWSVFQDYIYRESTLLASVHPTEGTRFFGPDHLGTPRAVFNSAGTLLALHTYYPFGEEATAPTVDTQQMKFTGHERDLLNTPTNIADDTDYMHARQFSLQTARFHSFDPIGGNPRQPQSFNRYAYVLGNPLKYTDPTGLYTLRGRTEVVAKDPCSPPVESSTCLDPDVGWHGDGGGNGGGSGDGAGQGGEGGYQDSADCDFACQVASSVGAQTGWLADLADSGAQAADSWFPVISAVNSLVEGDSTMSVLLVGAALIPGPGDSVLAKPIGDLISGSLKASSSYRSELATKTVQWILDNSKQKGPVGHAARQMKKLWRDSDRLREKGRSKPR